MRRTLATVACSLSLSAPAGAIVGDAQPAESPIVRPAVMILNSHGGCSGAVLGQDLVLTAAHCVNAATQIRVAGPGTGWTDVQTVVQHPQFKAGERRAPDLALLKMIKPAPALPPTLLAARSAALGDRLIVVGYGLAAEDDRWTFGTARMATLTVNRLYNNLMELIDRAAIGEHRTRGGCKGDSGGPAFAVRGGAPLLVGIITSGYYCGGATWAAPLARHHDWIVETARLLD
jgi:hypothetical protein